MSEIYIDVLEVGGETNSDSSGEYMEVYLVTIPDDLVLLHVEKALLKQLLRLYEKEFFVQHNRQVSSYADFGELVCHYRRYNIIKNAIAQKKSSD